MEITKKILLCEIEAQLSALLPYAEDLGQSTCSADAAESGLLSQLLRLGLQLLKYVFLVRLSKLSKDLPINIKEYKSKGKANRCYGSIFGEFDLSRPKYYKSDLGSIYPLDVSLHLPKEKCSYLLQKWIGSSGTMQDYRGSVQLVNEILGMSFSGDDSKRMISTLAAEVDSYYEQAEKAPLVQSGHMLALGWDSKGVPMILEYLSDKQKKMPKDKRLKKGEKRGIKKMATVSVSAEFEPVVRDKEAIIRGLFRKMKPTEKQKPKNKNESSNHQLVNATKKPHTSDSSSWYENIHRRAFLSNQQKAIDYGLEQVKARSTATYQPDVIALVDGGTGLEQNIQASFEQYSISHRLKHIILDIIHVEEYLWKAANVIIGSQSDLRISWVESAMRDLLDGQVTKLIVDLKKNQEYTKLPESQKEILGTVIRYFTNHQHKMQYNVYLEKGLPISTAIVESTCKHLVKDRMEGSGMRWKPKGAQQMMDCRAVNINKDWNEFIEFVKKQNNLKRNTWDNMTYTDYSN